MSQVIHDLENGGTLSKRLPGYQERPSQIEMATIVEQCIENQQSACLEAPTGTGKSLAYLIPAVRKATSMRKVTVISTSNKALQAQIFNKDVPFVRMNVEEFKAALLKGMNNFLCLDRLESYEQDLSLLGNPIRQRIELEDLVAELKSHEGDFEKLSDQHEDLRVKINGQTDQCLGVHCKQLADCFYYNMKEKAKNADVIVTNHTMLLMDIALGGRMLPSYDVLIIDEAHNLEKEAQEVFSSKVTKGRFLSLINNKEVKKVTSDDDRNAVETECSKLFSKIEKLFEDSPKDKIALTEAFLTNIKAISIELENLVFDLVDTFSTQVENLTHCSIEDEELDKKIANLNDDAREEAARYRKLSDRASKLAHDVQRVFSIERIDHVHTAARTKNRKGESVFEAICMPLDVSQVLGEDLFGVEKTVVCTSATLTSANSRNTENFDMFIKRVGMKPDSTRLLPSVFDYQSNALFYFPSDISQPLWNNESSQLSYENQIAARMQKLVEYSQGRAFLLFSSNKMMNAVHRQLRVPYPILKQGDLPRAEMIRRFKERPSVLLGVASFWEGVDIAGDALSLVVIDKLPFDPPDDPIQQGTVNLIKLSGGNEWESYIIPRLIIRLKQGVGRLIRTDKDRGVVAILDQRLFTKRYGKQVRMSLPPAPRTSDIGDVARFFGVEIEADPSEDDWSDAVGW